MEPARFDEMRPGCFDIEARVADMDVAGIWASLCFPSLVAGFCGAVFSRADDPELGLACTRAWNTWHQEVWAGTHPERIIPLQLPWLADPGLAAEELRRNADRGFKAVSFPEFPAQLGYPSIFTTHWDPFFEACQETDTVVCLHTGASSWAPLPSPDPPFELLPTVFPVNALIAAAEWVWSGVAVRFPGLSVALSEGGIGWVPMLMDRVDYVLDHSASGTESGSWHSDLRPSEVLGPQLLVLHHRRPVDHPGTRAHRAGPRDGGERLSPRRLHLARHAGRAAVHLRPPTASGSSTSWLRGTPPGCSGTRSHRKGTGGWTGPVSTDRPSAKRDQKSGSGSRASARHGRGAGSGCGPDSSTEPSAVTRRSPGSSGSHAAQVRTVGSIDNRSSSMGPPHWPQAP